MRRPFHFGGAYRGPDPRLLPDTRSIGNQAIHVAPMTMTTMPDLSMQSRSALGLAAAASVVAHLAVALAVAAFVSMRPATWGTASAAITVNLVAPQPVVDPAPLVPELPAPVITSVDPGGAVAPATTSETAPPPAPAVLPEEPPRAEPAQPAAQPSVAAGKVDVAENYAAVSGLPEELANRTHGEFLIEVDKLAQVVRQPDIAYPPEALAAGREGKVMAWIALDREGAITETIIVSGEPEFAAAVEAALPTARFLPAINAGEAVPFYIILNFNFRGV